MWGCGILIYNIRIYIYTYIYIRILNINYMYIYIDIIKYIDSPKMRFGVSSFFHETQPVF